MRRSTPQHSSGTVEGYSPEPEREKFAGRWSEEPQVIYEEPDWGTFGSNQAATYDPRRTGPNPAAAIMAEADPIFGTGGTRMERRLAKRRAKRQRLLAILAITGLGLAVAITAAVILMGGKAKVAPGAGAANAARTVQAASLPAPVLLAHTNPAGGVDAMFVLAPGKTAGGGVALVPPGTLTEVPGFGPEPLGSALASLGPTGLLAATENLLGVGIAQAVVVNDAQLAALVSPAGALSVNVAHSVVQTDATGAGRVVFAAGTDQLSGTQVPLFISRLGSGDQLAELSRQEAFITAWLARLGQDPGALPEGGTLRPVLAVISRGRVTTATVPVDELGQGSGAVTLFRVRSADLAPMVSSVFTAQASRSAVRPKVQILNGAGTPGLDAAVFDKIVPRFDVSLTGNEPTFGHAATQIVFYNPAEAGAAAQLRQLIGVGQVVQSRQPNGVVDLTVMVGTDFHP